MKGYGLPRNLDIEFPDLADIRNFGLKTSTGQLESKGGDYRGSSKKNVRNRNRRFWKKQARINAKRSIYKELH